MKSILSCFIFIFLIHPSRGEAVTFTAFRDAPEGTTIQKFEFIKNSIRYSKTSNFFDPKDDYRLGSMTAVDQKEIGLIKAEIDDLHRKLEVSSKALKKLYNIELSDLRTDERHAPAILIGGHKLAPRTLAYKTAHPILQKLLALEWKLLKGINLTTDGTVEKFSAGRKISSVPKHEYFRCNQRTGTEICQHLDEVLYVK